MSFPFGRPIIAMLIGAVVTGACLLARSNPSSSDLTLWVFADSHARTYRGVVHGKPSLLEDFRKATGKAVRLDLINGSALDVRLQSLFMSVPAGAHSASLPDVVEVEIGSVGKFFRPPVSDIGFLPLNSFLEKSGFRDRILPTRLMTWSKDGVIFGIPHDCHPCTITYRKDLFDQAGVKLADAKAWPEFQRDCLRFQKFWDDNGEPRRAIGLSTTSADSLLVMLQQRRVELVDQEFATHLTDPKVRQTICWYAQAVTGPGKIGADFNAAPGQATRDLAMGDRCAMITPDWQNGMNENDAPDLLGKLGMMALPRFDPTDAPTASMGGTMIGITRFCRDPQLAWHLIEALYLDPRGLNARQSVSHILPPLPSAWSDPAWHRADPFFSGQKTDELYIALAPQLPVQHITTYTTSAQLYLSFVMTQAVNYVKNRGNDGLDAACAKWLADSDAKVREMIRFDRS